MSTILIIVGVVIAILLAFWLLKSIIQAILVVGLIYILFHVGYIWNSGDLNEKLHLDSILSPETNEKLQEKYNSFTNKRDENELIETEIIKKVIDDSIAKATQNAKNIDKEKFIEELSKNLESFNKEDVKTALDKFNKELSKYNITPEEIQKGIE